MRFPDEAVWRFVRLVLGVRLFALEESSLPHLSVTL